MPLTVSRLNGTIRPFQAAKEIFNKIGLVMIFLKRFFHMRNWVFSDGALPVFSSLSREYAHVAVIRINKARNLSKNCTTKLR